MIPNAVQVWDRDRVRAEVLGYAASVAAGDLELRAVQDMLLPLVVPEWVPIHQARDAFSRLVSAIRRGEPTGEWLGVLTGGAEA